MIGNLIPPDSRSGVLRRSRPVVKSRLVVDQLPPRHYFFHKRLFDVIVGSLLAVLLAPVVAVVAVLIVATSRGPAFYTQMRLGRFGKPFLIWKLRTMRHNCEDDSGARWSSRGDRRVTFLGRMLRKLHIDEFPQLWNVLRGEMSLVGPRPERPEFFPILQAAVPHYADRLRIKPGVTGLAQAYLPPDENIDSVGRKQLYDLYYIRMMGWSLDLRLLLATVVQAIGAPHGIVRPLLGLPSAREIEGLPPVYVNTPSAHATWVVPSTPLSSA